MSSTGNTASDWTMEQRRNTRRLALWTAAWLVSVALAVFGPEFLWRGNVAISAGAVALQLAVGTGMILANRRHLLGLDELQQRIHLNAMGITLGVGLVAGIAYSSLDTADVIGADAEISGLVLIMGLTYLVSAIVGTRRYA